MPRQTSASSSRSGPAAELGWLCAGRVGKQKSKGEPVRFDLTSLREIHSAGISVDHTVCRAFEPYRRLLNGQEKHNFVGLWREHNKLVEIYQGDERWWEEHPEYLDPSDPLTLDREIYELEGLGEALKQGDPFKIILVHHQIRQALAREQSLESGLGWHALSIPFTLVAEDEKEPFLRDGIIPISLPPIERAIAHFEEAVEPLEPGTHDLYREVLIKLEVERRYREVRGWRHSLMGRRRLEIVYPDLSATRIEVLEAIHRSLPHEGKGDEILKVLPERSDFLTFLKAAAGLFELSPRSLAAQLGTAEERWKPGVPAGLKWLPAGGTRHPNGYNH